jgi:hypothetical protein
MAARIGVGVLAGAVLLALAFLRREPEAVPSVRPSAPAPTVGRPLAVTPEAPEPSIDPVDCEPHIPSPPYATVLIKSTATRRHWRLDPREVQAVREHRTGALPGLLLSANFGGGVRVEHPSDLRLGIARDLEKGDVVREMNGIQIRDESQFRLLAGRLWNKTGLIRATVDRGGSSIAITYQRADAPLPPATFR